MYVCKLGFVQFHEVCSYWDAGIFGSKTWLYKFCLWPLFNYYLPFIRLFFPPAFGYNYKYNWLENP
jgi:hypothetical protein